MLDEKKNKESFRIFEVLLKINTFQFLEFSLRIFLQFLIIMSNTPKNNQKFVFVAEEKFS